MSPPPPSCSYHTKEQTIPNSLAVVFNWILMVLAAIVIELLLLRKQQSLTAAITGPAWRVCVWGGGECVGLDCLSLDWQPASTHAQAGRPQQLTCKHLPALLRRQHNMPSAPLSSSSCCRHHHCSSLLPIQPNRSHPPAVVLCHQLCDCHRCCRGHKAILRCVSQTNSTVGALLQAIPCNEWHDTARERD